MTSYTCSSCGTKYDDLVLFEEMKFNCKKCKEKHNIVVFPASQKVEQKKEELTHLVDDEQANCFHHENKIAVNTCFDCGKFLCDLCSLESNGKVVCSECFNNETNVNKNKHKSKSILYDEMALSLSFAPVIMIWPPLLTSPIAIFLAIKHWNGHSILKSFSKPKFVISIILSLITMSVPIGFIISFLNLMGNIK